MLLRPQAAALLMSLIRETSKLLRNTALVTLAAVLGFSVGSAFGVPVWLQGFFLLPAAVLFYKLSGDPLPPWWRMIAFCAVLSVYVGIFTLIFPLVPQRFQTLAFMILIMLMPWTPMQRWLDHRFGKATPASK